MEKSGGILLFMAALLAIVCANTPLESYYDLLLSTPFEVRFGQFELIKPLLLWINDGLMAIFFFMVGLELKREFITGELREIKTVILPAVGAVGGMLVPALIYVSFNLEDPQALKGWAIPSATDIAFALGVLALLGPRVPLSLKVFLTSLAIFDDVGAIIIIALFYTDDITPVALLIVACCLPVLVVLNRLKIQARSLYLLIGLVMWIAMLKSGVHATLTGVLLAMFIPMQSRSDENFSPLHDMEQDLRPGVSFFILPLFAFANAGLDLKGIGLPQLMHGVPMGIACGLFIGKQLGIFTFCWLAVKTRFATMPADMSWISLYGTTALCGIGFTMSLFIGSLAFQDVGINQIFDERLGIVLGSMASGLLGYIILNRHLPEKTG